MQIRVHLIFISRFVYHLRHAAIYSLAMVLCKCAAAACPTDQPTDRRGERAKEGERERSTEPEVWWCKNKLMKCIVCNYFGCKTTSKSFVWTSGQHRLLFCFLHKKNEAKEKTPNDILLSANKCNCIWIALFLFFVQNFRCRFFFIFGPWFRWVLFLFYFILFRFRLAYGA